MPIYEYKCLFCGESCELIQKFSDEPATLCQNCNKEGLERQISAPLFQLKGTGWYVTDFRNKDKPKPTTSQSPSSETEGNTSEKKNSGDKAASETEK